MVEPEEIKPVRVKPTRDEIREALTCPICKTPGALLGDKCFKCGSFKNDKGEWETPNPETPKHGQQGNPWFDWRD